MIFRFSVDDTIWVLRDLSRGNYKSIFEHEYLAFYKKLHEMYDLKVHFNLFYETDGFNLSQMTSQFKSEFENNADWIQFSFHSRSKIPFPYANSAYEEVKQDCMLVNEEIIRFSSEKNLNPFTTIHCCACTEKEGVAALYDCGVRGLVGLFGTEEKLRISYDLSEETCRYMQNNSFYKDESIPMWYIRNDMVINLVDIEEIEKILSNKIGQEFIEIMIHEQFFFEEYPKYEGNAKEKVLQAVSYLCKQGYKSCFLNEII